jgi:hypothetical protein
MFTLSLAKSDCLSQLQTTLESLPVDDSSTTIKDNLTLINTIGRPGQFIPLLHRILSDRDLLAEVAARSYHHVNHFDKIVLVGNDKERGYRLTLHLWNPPYTEKELEDELIHDHRFNFCSLVLAGVLTSDNFIQSPEGRVYRQYRYIPEKRTATFLDFYQFAGEVKLLKTEPSRKHAGQSYYLAAPSIHQVLLPHSSITCTLVLRGPRQRSYANVFNTEYPKDNTQFDNSMFSESALASKITALVNTMEKSLQPGKN